MKQFLILLIIFSLISCKKDHTAPIGRYCFHCWNSFNGVDEGVKCAGEENHQFTDGRGNDLNCFEIH